MRGRAGELVFAWQPLSERVAVVQPFDTTPMGHARPCRRCLRVVKRFTRALSSAPPAMILGVEFIVPMTSNLDEYECVGECRDRLRAADFTTRFASSFVAS